jgi:hypothetical protein
MSRPTGTVLAVILAVVVVAPSAWADPTPSGSPSTTASPAPTPSFSPPPTVDEATQALQRQQRALATESATLAKAALAANATLQAYQQARADAAEAAAEAVTAQRQAEEARRATGVAHAELEAYAGSMYRFGRVDPRLVILTAALTSSQPQQFFRGLDMARQVGEHRGRVLEGLAVAQDEQARAAVAATDASRHQAEATTRAAAANVSALAAVAAYRAKVVQRRAELARTSTVLQRARLRATRLDAAAQAAGVSGWTPAAPCAGGDVSGLANGRLPLAALCPLVLAPGKLLRSDAAYAFNSMATEYAATYGTPLCVTDAYRSFDAQVAVKAEKPLLAAHPGRSNHGWGIAADLCGGIESFGTPAHEWMNANAMLFGWFHPPWAEPTGSNPEPWHWEFAG